MAISVTCSCGKSFSAKPELAGRRVACPSCGAGLTIPTPPAARSASASIRPAAASSPVKVQCQCGKGFMAKPELVGKTVACPNCGNALKIARSTPKDSPTVSQTPAHQPAQRRSLPQATQQENDPLGLGQVGYGAASTSFSQGGAWGPALNSGMPTYPPNAHSAAPRKSSSLSPRTVKRLIIGSVIGAIVLVLLIVGAIVVPMMINVVKKGASVPLLDDPATISRWPVHPNGFPIAAEFKMPQQVPTQTRVVDTKFGKSTQVIFVNDFQRRGAFVMVISEHNYPPGIAETKTQAMLDNGRDTVVQSLQATIVSQRDIQIGRYQGREYVFTGQFQGRKIESHVKIVQFGNYFFSMNWTGTPGTAPEAAIRYFFDSLRFPQ